jgi:hypothetical protein
MVKPVTHNLWQKAQFTHTEKKDYQRVHLSASFFAAFSVSGDERRGFMPQCRFPSG